MKIYQLRISCPNALVDSKINDIIDDVYDPSFLYKDLEKAKRDAEDDYTSSEFEEDGDELPPFDWVESTICESSKWSLSMRNDEWAAVIYETEVFE